MAGHNVSHICYRSAGPYSLLWPSPVVRVRRSLIIRGGHPHLGFRILPSEVVSDTPSLVCTMQLLKAKYVNSN